MHRLGYNKNWNEHGYLRNYIAASKDESVGITVLYEVIGSGDATKIRITVGFDGAVSTGVAG